MASLFIIGNGFDLAHGMKTSFNDFRDYMYTTYPKGCDNSLYVPESVTGPHGEDLQSREDVAGLIVYLLNGVASDDEGNTFRQNWNEIENLLGKMDLKECFDCVEPQYDKEGDRNYFWERDIAESICGNMVLAIPQITDFLSDWIHTVEIPKTPKKRFQEMIKPNEDLFLTFNYTQTLEKIYSCAKENVCHIHGVVADDFFQDEELILGHCGEEDYADDESVPYEMGDGLQYLYNLLKKDTLRQINQHGDFFNKISRTHIEKIYSFGFSFSEVDMPYIITICNVIDTKQIAWGLHSFNNFEERQLFKQKLRKSGFMGNFFEYATE